MASAGQWANGPCRGALNTESRVQGLNAWPGSVSEAKPGPDSAGQWANGPCRGALNTGSGVQGLRVGQCVGPNSSAGFP